MAQVHKNSPLTQVDVVADDCETRKSLTGFHVRDKLKNLRASSPKNGYVSDPQAPTEATGVTERYEAASEDTGAEVLGLMRTNTHGSADAPAPIRTKSPTLEKRIDAIDDSDDEDNEQQSGVGLPPKLKRHISSVPVHDYDSGDENAVFQDQKPPAQLQKHDSGTAGSEFEVDGLMRITTNDATRDAPSSPGNNPEMDDKIAAIPAHDEKSNRRSSMARMQKTISEIPVDDYDSDADQASYALK